MYDFACFRPGELTAFLDVHVLSTKSSSGDEWITTSRSLVLRKKCPTAGGEMA
jgi:hypothetical protein